MQNKLTSVNRWIFRKLSNRLLLWYLREVQRTYRRDNRSYTSANSQDKHGEQLNFMYFACKNSQNDSKVCCPLIGQKITKAFWHQSEARTAATVWNWSGKTLSPGTLLPILYFSSRHFFSSRLAPTICPWISENSFSCAWHHLAEKPVSWRREMSSFNFFLWLASVNLEKVGWVLLSD